MDLIGRLFYLARPLMGISVGGTVAGLNLFEFVTIVFTLLLLGIACLASIAGRVGERRLSSVEAWMLLYIGWCTLSSLYHFGEVSFKAYARLILPLVTYIILKRSLRDRECLLQNLGTMILIFAVPILTSVFVIVKGGGVDEDVYLTGFIRYRGVYAGAHEMGHSVGFLLMLSVVYWTIIKRGDGFKDRRVVLWKLIWFGVMVLGGSFCIYYAQTRTVMIGLAVFCVVYLFCYNKLALMAFMGFGAAVVGICYAAFAVIFYDVVPAGESSANLDRAGSGRPMIWKHNWVIFERATLPEQLLGFGIGNFLNADGAQYIWSSHNDWLQTLMETGAFGLIILIGAFGAMLRMVLRMTAQEKYAFAALWSAVVLMNFMSNSYISRVPIGQMFYMLLVYCELPWASGSQANNGALLTARRHLFAPCAPTQTGTRSQMRLRRYIPALLFALWAMSVPASAEVVVTELGAVANDAGDDSEAFRRAFARSGDAVRVPSGRYVLKVLVPYLPLRSGLEVRCDEGAMLIVPADAVTENGVTRHGYQFSPVFGSRANDPIVRNVRLTGCGFVIEKTGVTPVLIDRENGVNLRFEDLTVDGKGRERSNRAAYGILVNNATKLTIRNVSIAYTTGPAIVARLPRQCVLQGNHIAFSGVDAGYPFHAPVSAKLQVDYWNSGGISAVAAQGCQIQDNVIDKTGGVGIILRGGASDCSNNSVTNNRLSNIGKGGIGIGINSGGNGSTRANVIAGNQILGYMQRWADAGINVNHRGMGGGINNLNIVNNKIDLYAPGDDGPRYPTHKPTADAYGAQIFIDPSEQEQAVGVQISGNEFRNALGPAISGRGLRGAVIKDNTIVNPSRSVREGAAQSRPSLPRNPLVLRNSVDSTISGNLIVWSMLPAIHVEGKGIKVEHNSVVICPKNGAGLRESNVVDDLSAEKGANVIAGNTVRTNYSQKWCK